MERDSTGEGQLEPSHMVIARYRLDETGAMTHLKVVRPSYYGIEITEQSLARLKEQRFPPTVVDGKAVPVCVDVAITVNLP
jgi:hypothetical protein